MKKLIPISKTLYSYYCITVFYSLQGPYIGLYIILNIMLIAFFFWHSVAYVRSNGAEYR